jgi:hypothetical protein
MGSIHWTRIVDLARQIREDYATRGGVDVDVALRLARSILLLQEQMVGNFLRTMRRP